MISISRQNLQNAITDVLTCRSTLPACRLIKTDVLFRLNPKERNLSKPISRPSTVVVAVSSLSKCSFFCFRCPITLELSSRPHFGNSTSPSLPARTRNPLGKKPSTKSLQEWMTVFRNISNHLTGWTSWEICKLKLRQLLFLLFELIFFLSIPSLQRYNSAIFLSWIPNICHSKRHFIGSYIPIVLTFFQCYIIYLLLFRCQNLNLTFIWQLTSIVLTFHLHDVHEIQQPPPFFYSYVTIRRAIYKRNAHRVQSSHNLKQY